MHPLLVLALLQSPTVQITYDFSKKEDAAKVEATQGGDGQRKGAQPHLEDGRLSLIGPWSKSYTTAALPAPAKGLFKVLDVEWTTTLSQGTEGFSFNWLPTKNAGIPTVSKWEEPDVEGAFSIGFQASDPVNKIRSEVPAISKTDPNMRLRSIGMDVRSSRR